MNNFDLVEESNQGRLVGSLQRASPLWLCEHQARPGQPVGRHMSCRIAVMLGLLARAQRNTIPINLLPLKEPGLWFGWRPLNR